MGFANGMLNDYHFVTRWRVRGTVKEVLYILGDAEDLPRWWPSVYIEVKKHDDVVELFTKGWLPYTLRWSFRVTERRPDGFVIEALADFVARAECLPTQARHPVDILY